MSSIFSEVTFKFRGEQFVIPPDRILKAIAIIEETITLKELIIMAQNDTAPISRIAIAFASVLRFAGCRVTDDEVYASMFRGGAEAQTATTAIQVLLNMMVPEQTEKKEAPKGNSHKGGVKSSRKRSSASAAEPQS